MTARRPAAGGTEEQVATFRRPEAPIGEVPAGHVLTHVQDHGGFSVDPARLGPATTPRFPPFPEEVRDIRRHQHGVVGGPMNTTPDRWEHGFRCDARPWGEIAYRQTVVDARRRFTAHLPADDEASREKRHDVFGVVNALVANGRPPRGIKYGPTGTVTAKRVGEIADWLFSPNRAAEQGEVRRRVRRLIKPDRVFGPNRVPLPALLDATSTGPNRDAEFDPRDLVDEADVILAVDVDSQQEQPVFGRAALERTVRPGGADPPVVLRVEIEMGTEDLDTLTAVVHAVKGRSDG